MPSTYPIKGIPTTGGALPVRPELSSWSISKEPQHQKQVSLFLRALDILQKKDPVSDQLSYFRLATIHGAPGKPWDNAANPENSMGSAKGYCYHNSYLFPVWHRPFMALYEQCLYNVMINEILPQIKDVSQRSSWEQAAKQWRLPFWDWAIPQADTKALGLPRIASQEQFSILKLDGTGTEAIGNPMQKYTNRVTDNGQLKEVPMGDSKMGAYQITYNVHDKIDKKIELDFGKSKSTSRFANPQDEQEWANGYQRPELVNNSLQNPNWRWKDSEELTNGSLAHNVHRLLSENYFKSYKTFSSTLKGPGQDPKENLSLEMLHNNIHQWTGGGGRSVVRKGSEVVQVPVDGHMANVPVSSFDPIFWMHHNNVDRLFAIWQTLNPNRWLEASNPDDPQGSSKLVPFHRDEKATLFTVDDTRDWRKLGYTYPELGEGVTQAKLANLIFEKYGRQSVDELRDSKDGSGITDTHFQDYVINVDYDRYALDGQPYTICFTLELSDDKKYEVGQVFNFSAQLNRDCGNCNSQATEGVMSKGQVPLTPQLNRLVRKYKSFLRDASGVTGVDVGLNPEFMNVFLNNTLFWHVRTNAGNEVPLDQVPNLQVSIHTGKAGFDDAKGAIYNVD